MSYCHDKTQNRLIKPELFEVQPRLLVQVFTRVLISIMMLQFKAWKAAKFIKRIITED